MVWLQRASFATYSGKINNIFAINFLWLLSYILSIRTPLITDFLSASLSVSLICCVFNAAVSHEQLSPCHPWFWRKGRNSTGWYRSLRKGTRTCLPAASVRWTSLWGISSFLLSTKGSNATAPHAWTRLWISPLLPRMASWGEHPILWRWASRSRRRTTIACQRLLEESVSNRKT